MERYHSTAGDPPRRDMTAKAGERAELERQMAEFLARGGQVQQVGAQMADKAVPFVINARTTPVYSPELAPTTSQPASQPASQHRSRFGDIAQGPTTSVSP